MEIPTYKITIDLEDQETGLDAISLVQWPAVEREFLAFSQDKKEVLQFADEEKHIITGVALLCGVPIYRRNGDYEYYVVFDRESISNIVEKYSKMSLANSVNIEHDDSAFVDNIFMIESYIKDSTRGIVPSGFEDVPDGSWIVSYKVNNPEVWEDIKSGKVKGFSVQGIFNLIDEEFSKTVKVEEPDYEKECLSLLCKIIKHLN